MCIAFDGAYILEAPAADPGITDEHRPTPEITAAGAGGEDSGGQNRSVTADLLGCAEYHRFEILR